MYSAPSPSTAALEGPRAPTIITTLSIRPTQWIWLAHRAFDAGRTFGMSRIADHRTTVNAPATGGRRAGASGARSRTFVALAECERHAQDAARDLPARPRARAAAQGRGGPRSGTPALLRLRPHAARRRARPRLRARRRRVRALPLAPPHDARAHARRAPHRARADRPAAGARGRVDSAARWTRS